MPHIPHIAIRRELRRLDAEEFGGFGGAAGVTHTDFLAWLRSLPTGLGSAELRRLLKTGSGPTAGGGQHLPPRDQSFATPDLDVDEELFSELHRLLANLPASDGWCLNGDFDRVAAVRALRSLPDNAGWNAIAALVPIGRITAF